MRFRSIGSLVAALAIIAAACAGSGPVATVDGVELTRADLEAIHPDVDALTADELASSVLLLILHETFRSGAGMEFGIEPDPSLVDDAFESRTVRYTGRGDLDDELSRINLTRERIRIESYLDVVRDAVSAHLVRSEGPGFDLDQAYEDYLLAEGHVCVRHIQVAEVGDYDIALARLEAGDDFTDVALDLSVDPFVARDDGGTGAGGDLGCSNPGALPVGLSTAAIDAPLDAPTGPIVSAVGVHLLEVYERAVPALVDVRDLVIEAAIPTQGAEVFRLWAVSLLQEIDVDIDPEIGTWGVLPETDPVPTVVEPARTGLILDG
jgi:parvulin-like peptidyl-prolyl isomerase